MKQERYDIHCDSQSALDLSKNAMYHSRTKHIDVRYHWLSQVVEEQQFKLEKIHTDENPADMMTKVVTGGKLQLIAELIGIVNIPPESFFDNEDGRYLSGIVTSASLFGFAADDIEVKVYSVGGTMFDGIIVGYDAHYNLAIINIISDGQMPAATLRHLDDAVSVHPALAQSSRDKLLQRPHSRDFRICAGDMVVALGRNCKNFDLMAAPGKFR
ncbi:Unknown protein [Striga hermonthica]|uniref:Uncharacterized protein n=1 Tax=Striga hermonthica TaxID=68872 RepID=A0A9N7RTU4_STRHE|nr:Unknown protein [Striga hermonthica]